MPSKLKRVSKAGHSLPKGVKKFGKVSGKVLGTPKRAVKALDTLSRSNQATAKSIRARGKSPAIGARLTPSERAASKAATRRALRILRGK